MTVKISQEVFDGLESVRESGITNMLDYPKVIQLCTKFGYPESAKWLKAHRSDYTRLIFEGPEIEDANTKT